MKPTPIARRLNDEADRHVRLSNGLAVKLFYHPDHKDAAKWKRLAEDHKIRAETYRTAARMCD